MQVGVIAINNANNCTIIHKGRSGGDGGSGGGAPMGPLTRHQQKKKEGKRAAGHKAAKKGPAPTLNRVSRRPPRMSRRRRSASPRTIRGGSSPGLSPHPPHSVTGPYLWAARKRTSSSSVVSPKNWIDNGRTTAEILVKWDEGIVLSD
ncbi:hypothetical protein DL767_003625 [Monosporascus sp. MG133]|nr:hypothetical protein DL767_003625 [Monosporascus sp. MG133]